MKCEQRGGVMYVCGDHDNSLGGVECTAYHPGSRSVADIVSVTMPLLSIKRPCSCYFYQSREVVCNLCTWFEQYSTNLDVFHHFFSAMLAGLHSVFNNGASDTLVHHNVITCLGNGPLYIPSQPPVFVLMYMQVLSHYPLMFSFRRGSTLFVGTYNINAIISETVRSVLY